MRKTLFTLRVTEPWNRFPKEFVESPSLEIFKTCLDTVLCSLLWVTLLWQGVGLSDPQRSLPTPAMLGFCDSSFNSSGSPGAKHQCWDALLSKLVSVKNGSEKMGIPVVLSGGSLPSLINKYLHS